MKKRIASAFLAACLIFPLVSCRGESPEPERESSGRFRGTEVTLPDSFKIGQGPISLSGGILRVGGWFVEDYDYTDAVLTLNAATGEVLSDSGVMESADDGYRESGKFSLEDGYLTVRSLISDDKLEKVRLLRSDEKGKTISEYDCEELFGAGVTGISGSLASGEGFFGIVFAAESDGELYIVSNTGAVRIDRNRDIKRVDSSVRITGAVLTGGNLRVFDGNGVYDVDYVSGEMKKNNISGLRNVKVIPVPGYDFGGITGTAIHGWTRNADGEYEESVVCDLLSADIPGQIVSAAVGDDHIYAVVRDSLDFAYSLWRLDEIPMNEIKERKLLTIAVVGRADDFTTYAVCEFNRAHDDIRIEIKRYESESDTDFSSAVTEFERDALSGKLADILLIDADTGADITNYSEKGFFTDLTPLMERSGYDSGNILDSVKEMSGRDRIYYLPLETATSTLYGRAADFPDEMTLGTMLDKLENLGEDECLMPFMSFSKMLSLSLDEFIDYDTGKTDFGNDLFRRFAEDYKRFGDGYHSDKMTEDNIFAALANSETLLISRAPDAGIYAKCAANYGIDDLISVGYPTHDGGGTILTPKLIIAVSKDSSDPDAAFGFIRTRIDDKYILRNNSLSATVTKSSLDKYLSSLPRWLYYGKYGLSRANEPLDPETAERYVGEGYYEYHLTDEKLAGLRGDIQNARPVTPLEKKIISVIMEELDIYRNREGMSLDEVIKIIDNRVNTYYNEKN